MALLTLERNGALLRPLKGVGSYTYCGNAAHGVCNWLIPTPAPPDELCIACWHNQTIPDLSMEENLKGWRTLEIAKHRLFYTLLRLKLPLRDLTEAPCTDWHLVFWLIPPAAAPASSRATTKA
jgi:hypothetical protein